MVLRTLHYVLKQFSDQELGCYKNVVTFVADIYIYKLNIFYSTITLVNNPQYYLSRSDFVASTSSPQSLRA